MGPFDLQRKCFAWLIDRIHFSKKIPPELLRSQGSINTLRALNRLIPKLHPECDLFHHQKYYLRLPYHKTSQGHSQTEHRS